MIRYLVLCLLFVSCSSNQLLLERMEALEARIAAIETDITDYGEIDFLELDVDTILTTTDLTDIISGLDETDFGREFCSQCQKEGLKSRVYRGMGARTLMGTHEYWDENGYYHYEDPNYTSWNMWCSNGHKWITRE